MATKRKSKFTSTDVQTVADTTKARNRAAIERLIATAKTAVYIAADGTKKTVKREVAL